MNEIEKESIHGIMRRKISFLIALALCGTAASIASACKYSVRDVGFVDLDASRYRLTLCVPGAMLNQALQEVVQDALAETNVDHEFVDAEGDVKHATIGFLRAAGIANFPAALLTSADGRRLPIPLARDGHSDVAMIKQSIAEIVTAEFHQPLFEKLLESHSVILLIEGNSSEHNRRARQIAKEAIKQIGESLAELPKPIAKPSALMVVSPAERERQRILLWSLGSDEADPNEAQLALLFGRGRRLGPLLTVPGSSATELVNHLGYVGQSCECELDRSWMQGPMIPHRWDFTSKQRALKRLGFDADNTRVKSEIAQILSRGPGSKRLNRNIGILPSNDDLLGYKEFDLGPGADLPAEKSFTVEAMNNTDVATSVAGETGEAGSSTAADSPFPSPPTPSDSPVAPLSRVWIALGGLALLVLIGGTLLYFRR